MSNSSEFADTFERSQIRYTTMDFWRSGNGVYGLVEESAQEEEEAATLGGLEEEEEEEGGSRRCLRQHVLGAWTKAKEIYCFAPCIYGISALRPIYIPSDEAARNARTAIPNNCFWKCERASLLTTLSLLFFFFLSFFRGKTGPFIEDKRGKCCLEDHFVFFFERDCVLISHPRSISSPFKG